MRVGGSNGSSGPGFRQTQRVSFTTRPAEATAMLVIVDDGEEPVPIWKQRSRYEDAGSGRQFRAEIAVKDTAMVSGRKRAWRKRKTLQRSSRRLPSRSGSASEGRAGCGRTGSRSSSATRC